MKLADLPAMLVERVETNSGGLRVHGRFDRLEGVGEAGQLEPRLVVERRLPAGALVVTELAVVETVQDLVKRFRSLPGEQRRRLPALGRDRDCREQA